MRTTACTRTRRPGVRRLAAAQAGALAALALPAGAAQAAGNSTSYEFWPEINAYYGIDERSRLLLTAAGTRNMEVQVEGRNTLFERAQFTLNYDYTLEPVLRRDVPALEWSKNRLLWARVGFDYGTSVGGSYRSYTGLAELNSRLPLAGDTWLTSRLRADFRHINGEPSQRYRIRLGAEWAAVAYGHPYAPSTSAELLYDTRFDRWSRATLKAGLETPIDPSWRVEPYVALQLDKPDDRLSRLIGLGLTFKYYFD